MNIEEIKKLLGPDADELLNYECKGIPRKMIHAPGPD
ncbi:MAG: fructose-bisphosphate aldolase, partial [Candidatus Lokiarchaeota archaeon]|nr:fructose-bisphosphate aldolase [Candidatus Lokiarchaeota archaeon]MBD3337628.1 fructose-bisphosphate aldolase [Candidatus Lokiarchaeota archaeon]